MATEKKYTISEDQAETLLILGYKMDQFIIMKSWDKISNKDWIQKEKEWIELVKQSLKGWGFN